MTVQQAELKYCTQHPQCAGPKLIANHDTECPFGGGDDCDNDQCWVGCPHCSSEAQDAAAPRH